MIKFLKHLSMWTCMKYIKLNNDYLYHNTDLDICRTSDNATRICSHGYIPVLGDFRNINKDILKMKYNFINSQRHKRLVQLDNFDSFIKMILHMPSSCDIDIHSGYVYIDM